jgi:hypothetical protein
MVSASAGRHHRATGNTRHSTSHSRITAGPEGWLIGERPLPGERGDVKWYFSTLPADTAWARLIALAHQRWVIAQFYEDAKGECGLDNYQGRRWDGMHRHAALSMLAYSFLQYHRLNATVVSGFSPLRAAAESTGGAPRRPALALPEPDFRRTAVCRSIRQACTTGLNSARIDTKSAADETSIQDDIP